MTPGARARDSRARSVVTTFTAVLSVTARTTSVRRARSARARPRRAYEGTEDARPDGEQRVTQRGLEVVDSIPAEPPARQGRRPGRKARSSRCEANEAIPRRRGSASRAALTFQASCSAETFHRAVVYEAIRADQAARRRGTASSLKGARCEGAGRSPGGRKARVALAPARSGRRTGPAAGSHSGRRPGATRSR